MMKPIVPPKSWRDLTHAELIALLEDQLLLIRPRDLVWAQWKVASASSLEASAAIQQSWSAEEGAFEALRSKYDSKTLAAYEAAKARVKRARATWKRLSQRADALYELHVRLREAERS